MRYCMQVMVEGIRRVDYHFALPLCQCIVHSLLVVNPLNRTKLLSLNLEPPHFQSTRCVNHIQIQGRQSQCGDPPAGRENNHFRRLPGIFEVRLPGGARKGQKATFWGGLTIGQVFIASNHKYWQLRTDACIETNLLSMAIDMILLAENEIFIYKYKLYYSNL